MFLFKMGERRECFTTDGRMTRVEEIGNAKERAEIYETRTLNKQEEIGYKVERLAVGRRRILVECERRETEHR